ncbi:MAG: cation:proton antiporter [Candidatus Bathyarchaeota archaeon]|nr:cation:proton antiporter [Candidatus Bathyarchaeota archaeon]
MAVDLYSIAIVAVAVVTAGIVGIKTRISSSIFEVGAGVVIANVIGIGIDPWLDFLGTFGGLILTFLAGAEVEFILLRKQARESLGIGTMAFLAPLIGILGVLTIFTDWTWQARLAGGLALTTTSVAVVYAVLSEYELIKTPTAKTIIAVTFVNDILTLIGINFIQTTFDWVTVAFVAVLVALVPIVPRLLRRVVQSFGKRAVEIEVRLVLAVLLVISFFADKASLHAVFGAFVLGLIFASSIQQHQDILSKTRTVTFALLAPAFFIRAGMLIAVPAVIANLALVFGLLGTKLAAKIVGCYGLCKKWIPEAPMFSTMLFSTGLTVGTITATLGHQLGFLSDVQFSVIVTAVILSAVVPTLIAKRFVPTKL